MKPCYNITALARHQREIDRQEAKKHWIAAAVDRLMDDADFVERWVMSGYGKLKDCATQQANREYQQHLSALEQARIDGMVSE